MYWVVGYANGGVRKKLLLSGNKLLLYLPLYKVCMRTWEVKLAERWYCTLSDDIAIFLIKLAMSVRLS